MRCAPSVRTSSAAGCAATTSTSRSRSPYSVSLLRRSGASTGSWSQSHPDMAFLEPMEMLAAAWISASAGAVTRAIEEARTAAVTAAARGLPAREVLCLQTATRFGDPTTAARLDELEQVVGGRRASAAAAHAAALGASSGERLMAASNRYAAMGDGTLRARCGGAGVQCVQAFGSTRICAVGYRAGSGAGRGDAATFTRRRSPTRRLRRYFQVASAKSSSWWAAA